MICIEGNPALAKVISKNTQEETILEGRSRKWLLGKHTLIMGILNVTSDSFYDGGLYLDKDAAVRRGMKMVEEGADIIDVGGESSRPGANPIPLQVEINRVVPVVETLVKEGGTVSVDTTKAEVARRVLDVGAEIINDISALRFDPEMASICARYRAAVVLMHMRGTPMTMQRNVRYGDILLEVFDFLKDRLEFAVDSGIANNKIALDPGIGFGKSVEDNMRLINNLSRFTALGRPIVIGTSRKSFIRKTLNLETENGLEGTAATVTASILKGAHIVRVHDVPGITRSVAITDAIKNS